MHAPDQAPNNWINATSLVGLAIIIVSVFTLLVVLAADIVTPEAIHYVGLAYGAALTGLGAGTLVALTGAVIGRRRARRGITQRPVSLHLDFNDPRQARLAVVVIATSLLALVVVSVSAYQSVVYLESDEFCGGACHSVMHPEATAHTTSAHSQVECVTCHVGSGAGPFIEAKLRGVRQLVHVIRGNFETPIPVPVADMGSAEKVCEQCHDRKRWVGLKEKVFTYYGSGRDNPVDELRMLIKIGGVKPGTTDGEGIHYHMNIGAQVRYIARDPKRQQIAWIEVQRPDGSKVEYNHKKKPLTAEERASLPVRRMDCMDCHSRPAHNFEPPAKVVNAAMAGGRLDPKMPSIKVAAVRALSAQYDSSPAAQEGIATRLTSYYRDEEPAYYADHTEDVTKAIAVVRELFARSQFPEMKSRWSAYPNDIGHRDWPGCFRCHNDQMVDGKGTAVFSTCTGCHVVLTQAAGPSTDEVDFEAGKAFYHVADDDTFEDYTDCSSCHDGGDGVY